MFEIASESHWQQLMRQGRARPRFLQGVFPFVGQGLFDIGVLEESLAYIVPAGAVAEVLYVRLGSSADDLVYVALLADGRPIRYFPVGPKSDVHVPLAIVEAHPPGARLSVGFAAPSGAIGTLIVDIGIVESAA